MSAKPGPDESRVAERRGEDRWNLCLPCKVQWRDRVFEAQSLDLSETGAFIESKQVIPEGEEITLSFMLGGVETNISSAVVHSGRYQSELKKILGYGVLFKNPPTDLLNHAKAVHHWRLPYSDVAGSDKFRVDPKRWLERLLDINKEVWLVLSLVMISGLINILVASNRMVLSFYTLPTLFSAYFYGRRHATLTALASVLLVVLVLYLNPSVTPGGEPETPFTAWLEITVWAGTLLIAGYAMGTLYEHMKRNLGELRQTYNGVLVILQHVISNDKYTHNHSYRVSIYATRIAGQMNLGDQYIEDVRAAALLHDIGKLDISREILYKASRLSEEEFEEMKKHVDKGVSLLEPIGGSLRRVLPLILAHHDNYDGTGYHPTRGQEIPLGARIIAVADAYDAMTSDRPYRKAMSPLEAKEIIEERSGKDFDPDVVVAFLSAFRRGEMEVPEIIL